ncbi:uncharacterized protein PAC_16838 [Phialocephala subalpina]|uniref:Peptidase S8/S53 domain-containing protein n=1 Tax=Phialocephala subalpina TaxID=576137 RepID=A0A1L7XPP2_9HELO|nr:uncharacterized protein PAC_16838 [Phialocephala subalpina]
MYRSKYHRSVHDIARSLEMRLGALDKPGLYSRLCSHPARFGDVLSFVEECKCLHEDMMRVYDTLEPLISGDDIDDDDPKLAQRSASYDDLFYSCVERLFDAMSCACKTKVELRLRLEVLWSNSLDPGQDMTRDVSSSKLDSGNIPWHETSEKLGRIVGGGQLIFSRHYRHAIEFCLKLDKAPKQPDLIRKSIYEHVVLPLEKAIAESDLNDEGFESLDLGLIKRATISIPIPQLDENFATGELEEGFDLFGEEDGVEPDKDSRAKYSDDWLKCFKGIIQARIKPASKLVSDRRVKVALLDTRINLKHSYFEGEYLSGRIKSVRSWVDGKEGAEDWDSGDESGHGTFIASLLLDLCPTIDLYVVRISKSRNFKKGTSVNVGNALYYTQKEWTVDIITMSFGFLLGIRDIWDQVTRATQNNILVFAAASNDGRNQSKMFPASQYSVFALHSTNGKGIKSDFNPLPAKDENFSILGEYIESAWLTNTARGSGSTRRLSGTSFATFIAVYLSAFLLTYVPVLIPNHEARFHKI